MEERWLFRKSTNGFVIKALTGPESGSVRTLHVRTAGEPWFLQQRQQIGFTKIE